jgi:Tol biopolymer transport system component
MTARALSLLFAATAAMLVLAVGAGATTPGPNGRIAFSSSRDGTSTTELYSAAADGTDAKRLTWSAAVEQSPAWSPDGTRIAYESVAGYSTLFVMNADGSGQTQLSPADGAADAQPSWSPDGRQLAFASTRGLGNTWHIWIVNVDGTSLHRLTSDFSTDPSWSPDGSRIAYATTDSISVIGADGTGVQRVTTPPAGFTDQAPDWSPDGSTIVFARSDFTTTVSDLYAIAPDGSGERKLTTGPLLSFLPSWSPDGTKIVFERREASGSYQLYELNADGSGVVPVATSAGNNLGPTWGTSAVVPTPRRRPRRRCRS